MNGLVMLRLFDSVYLVATATWLGSLLFLSSGLLPVAHQRLDHGSYRVFEALAWGRWSIWGAVCGSVALPSLVCGALGVPELRGPSVGIQAGVLLLALVLTLYLGNGPARVMTHTLNEVAADASRLERARRRVASLSSIVSLCMMALIVAYVLRGTPRGKGIEEPDSSARYQREQQAMKSKNAQMWSAYYDEQRKAQGKQASAPGASANANAEVAPGEAAPQH